jgi:hypothetical protein
VKALVTEFLAGNPHAVRTCSKCTSDKKRSRTHNGALTRRVCIVCNVPKAETSFNLAEEDMLHATTTDAKGLRRCQLKFCSSCRTPRPETEFGKFASCVHVGSRHVYTDGRQATGSVILRRTSVFVLTLCAVNTTT